MMPSSSSQLPTLPITAANAAAANSAGDPPAAALRHFFNRLADSARSSLANSRPWSELLDRSAFSRPDSISDATSRIRKNLAYFRVNYAAVVLAILALSLISNPFSLVVLLALFAAWSFLYLFRPSDPPLVLFGRQFSDRETVGGLVLLSVFVVFLTSVGSILMSALTIGAGAVAAHGAFRLPEDLFLDEQEGGGAATGLLSTIFGGAATNAATNAAAMSGLAVSARV